jgi:hypothetical protein
MTRSHPLLARLSARRSLGHRRPALPDRHAAFTARLAGARRSRRPISPVVRTLRRLRNWTLQVLRPVQVTMHFAWRGTAVQSMQSASPAPLPRTLLLARLTSRVATHHHTLRTPQHSIAPMRTMLLTSTRVERALRVEQKTIFPRMPLPLTRTTSASVRAEDRRSPAVVEAAAPFEMRPRISPSANAKPQAIALPPQELSRVTEHVIRQLDQRVLSYRERTGRI